MEITRDQIVAVLRGEPVEIDGMRVAWRTVHPDLRSSRGFRWPFPGGIATSDPGEREYTRGYPCPDFPGDGLCLARTWAGAASGGIPAITGLICGYSTADVLGEDADKLRVKTAQVIDLIDLAEIIRSDLSGANLGRANLGGAYLGGANLGGANLGGANLGRAYLDGANLGGANLGRANLGGANLDGANLDGANLDGANLDRANLGGWERGIDGFAVRKSEG